MTIPLRTSASTSFSRAGVQSLPFLVGVGTRQYTDITPLHKFGKNADVGTGYETVWSVGGLYPYPAAASVMQIASASANDAAAGTGARTVTIYGLDANYAEISETVTLNGVTSVPTANEYLRINRMRVRSAGSGGANAGAITAKVGATTHAQIDVEENQSLMTLWTVPAGYSAYLTKIVVSTSSLKVVTVDMDIRPFGEVFQVREPFVLYQQVHQHTFQIPYLVEEKSDIEIRAKADSTGGVVAASFELFYAKL